MNTFVQGLINAWYAFASPRRERPGDSYATRNAIRRSRTASWMTLIIILLVLAPVPGALSKPFVLLPLGIAFIIDCVAFYLNRSRHTTIAGSILIVTITIGIVGTLLSVPGGIGTADVPVVDLLVQSIIVAAFMIAPSMAFVMMGINILLIWAIFHSPKVSPEIAHIVATNSNLVVQAIEIQAIVAAFSYVIVYNSNKAIRELDRSEEIVALERREIEIQQEQLKEKEQLESGMQELQQTFQAAANGNYTARAALPQENVLWRVAYSLNTLLARLQGFHDQQLQLQRTQQALHQLAHYLRESKEGKQLGPLQRTGTIVDEVILELSFRQPRSGPATPPNTPENPTWAPPHRITRERVPRPDWQRS